MSYNIEKELKNSINKFELGGEVVQIDKIYRNRIGIGSLRFCLRQNIYGNDQVVPIVLKGSLVDTYGNKIQKGDWISVKGTIITYERQIMRNGKKIDEYEEVIVMFGFEIVDKTNNKVYKSDGQVQELSNDDEIER